MLTIHDIISAVEENEKRRKQFAEKIKRAHAVTYISNFVKEETHRHFDIPKDIPEYVIYNGNTISEIIDTTP